jgi:hypothetical protein
MPRTTAQTKRKTPAPAPTPTRAPSRRRAPQAQRETPAPAISGPDIHQGQPTIPPSPEPQEQSQEPLTTQPAPSEPHGPTDSLSPALAAELTALWPDLQALASWWQQRQHLAQEDESPDRKLVRQTYHIEQRYIEAVKREADRTGESYAAVVNRAFARYFTGR